MLLPNRVALNHFCVPLSVAEADAGWRERRERDASRQKQLESPRARWSPTRIGRVGRTGGRKGESARVHTLPRLQSPPASRPADASLRGSGSQRGGVAGQDADSGIVPCARLSLQLCALARSARRSPLSQELAPPRKSCAEKVPEDKRARAIRCAQGSFVKGPLREAMLCEALGPGPHVA